MNCPLCSGQSSEWSQDRQRSYFLCQTCELVFVPRDQMVSTSAEFARYDTHTNDENDPRYQLYLRSMVNTAAPFIKAGESGLDFGSGRTKLLAKIFDEQGTQTESYDIHYFPDETIWNKKYDFVILSEVIEHLREPLETMKRIKTILKDGGHVFVKTKFLPEDPANFKNWYYKNDSTHVQFFNKKSMEKLAQELQFKMLVFLDNDMTLLRA